MTKHEVDYEQFRPRQPDQPRYREAEGEPHAMAKVRRPRQRPERRCGPRSSVQGTMARQTWRWILQCGEIALRHAGLEREPTLPALRDALAIADGRSATGPRSTATPP